MIAVIGQSVIDRVKLPGHPWVERLGGAPLFAGQALVAAGASGVLLTRGATPELRRPLHGLGLPVIEGPSARSCVSEMVLSADGSCADSFAGFGDPFTPADVAGWMAPGLSGAEVVVCGAQWRDDFSPATVAALAEGGRPLYLDGQGPLRAPALGPLRLDGVLTQELAGHVTLLKLAEEEARIALGGVEARAARALDIPVVVVTLAERGAVVLADGRATLVGVEPVLNLADPIGAGDAFLALMAVAGRDGATPVEAARYACAGAAALLRRRVRSSHRARVSAREDGRRGPAAGGSPASVPMVPRPRITPSPP